MANMREVNKAIKATFPDLKLEAVRGDGYVYFDGEGFDDIPSVMANPVATKTADMVRLCLESVSEFAHAKAKVAEEAPAKAEEQQHHFFAGNRYNWCTAQDWEEAVQTLASQTDNDMIKSHARMTGGMVCVVCRVELPESAHYTISNYVPSRVMVDGEPTDTLVPISNTDTIRLLDNRGAWAKH